ncbi:MAG: ubiquinol-cytochrome c reductase cytochrome c1 subunit PetC [Rhodobacteraceae bacterium HLUCCA12]|nr:MAG: ubiquinol-cytochrome c reductase cytochrome c1 subunit PetC [Rhodobacteraceae bacterium HLUCCA12]
MIRKLALSALAALSLAATPALAAGELGDITDYSFSFEGPFGSYDQAQIQRGLQVYTEVCAACHGLQYVPFRTLTSETGPALSPEAMRAYAANFEVEDPESGEFRPAGGPDHFPESGMETAPDLSLMAKARIGFSGPYGLGINQFLRGIGGPEYIASFLSGFDGREEMQAGTMFYYNTAYDGWVSMNPVLFEDGVEYADGTPATVEQQAQDVAAFLMWAAEPKLTERKKWGFIGVIFLVLLASLLYLTNKRLWAPVKKQAKQG